MTWLWVDTPLNWLDPSDIEAVERAFQVAFDKTETLTAGRPVVTDVVVFDGS